MKKRLLSAFMALVLCLTLLPTAAFAEDADGGVAIRETITVEGGQPTATGAPTEGGGQLTNTGEGEQPNSETDTRTEIWCVSKPDSIGRGYDGTTDGSTIPIDLTFTDGTDTFTLKEGTGFTAKKTFDSADAGNHTVTVEITLIGETAKKYKLKAGKETFTIGGFINKAYPKLNVSLSRTTCTVGEKILPLLSVEGAPEGAAVTYYYTQYKSIAGDSDYEGNVIPAIDESTAISSLDEEGNNTYYVYAKTAETTNYKEHRSATVELTVTEPAAASVTKADGTVSGTYKTLPAALNAAQNGDTVKLLANHVTDADALNALDENFTFEQYASIVPVVTKTLTLDLNHKTVDYLEVGFTETNEKTQEKETLATGNLTVTSEAAYGRILNLQFMAGALDIRGGEIGGILVDDNGVESPDGGLVCDVNSGTATISGGTVLGLTVLEGAAVTVNGGSAHAGAWLNDSTLNITGGTFGNVRFRNNGGTIAISGGTFDTITNTNGSGSIPLMPLLADNYAFYQGDNAQNSTEKTLTNVTVRPHTHSCENGKCACGKQFEASVTAQGSVSYYDTIDSAFTAAHEGDTVTLLADITNRGGRGIFVSGGPYTLDLNGHRIEAGIDLMVGDMDGSGALLRGELTVKDSSTNNAGYVQSLKLWNGDLTVESGSFRWIVESGSDSVGTITITGGTADEVKHTSAGVTFRLSGGTFKYVENIVSGKPGDLLADNRAFFNRGDDSFVNGYDDRYQAVSDVVVKEHTHNIVDGSCECGFTCAHDWSDKNGVCPICGYHCPHNAGAAETGGVWACNTCGQTVTAMVTAPDGAITYYADGYVNYNKKSGLYFAIKAAKTGSTVAALGGEYLGGYVTGKKTLTLDVSNGKTIDGTLYVGENDKENKLIVRGSTEISYVIVDPGNTLDLTGWTGRIGSLTVLNGGKATLNGGTFAKLNVNGAEAGSLLTPGYAFQNADTGAYVEHSSTADMENVKVVKCPHSGVTLKADLTGAECKYCGASFAATLDDAPYDTIDDAVSAWLQKGGTLKLYADYTAADGTWSIGSGSHTINLNGYRMSVQGEGTFKPTNNMHLTVTDDKEIGQITNILLDGSQRGSFTLESGYVGNLKMTGDAVVTLKGGSVDELDVQNCSANTNLSIQGGSIGKLNIKDWVEGMHVSATSGSLGAYSLPSGKILADVLDHQYYAEGTSLDRQVDTAAQSWEKFDIKKAPYDFGSTSKAAAVPINGSIPFMVNSPSGDAGVYDVKWYRRTDSGAEHMMENKVAGVKVGDTLDVFCVITGLNYPGGAMQWQVAVKGYKLTVTPADLSQGAVVFTQTANEFGTMGNINDGKGTFVFTPWVGDANSATELSYLFEVSCNGRTLTADSDYTVKGGNTAKWAGTYTLTIEGKGNYTGTAAHQWEIKPYTLSKDLDVARIFRDYDGTANLSAEKLIGLGRFLENRISENPLLCAEENGCTIQLGAEDFEVSNVKLGSAEAGDTTASFTIKLKPRPGQTAANFVFEDGTSEMTVKEMPVSTAKAFLSSSPEAGELNVANDHAGVYTLDLAALLPALEAPREYGAVTYGAPTVNLSTDYYDVGTAKIENGKLILPIQAVETSTESNIGTVTVKVTSGNIVDFYLTIKVNATNKIVPIGEPTLSKTTLAWGEQLSTIALSGAMTDPTDNTKTVKGKFEWVAPGAAKETIGEYEAAWKFTPTDTAVYAETSGTVTITVTKATPTGAPKYTAITTGGKTLTDAGLTVNEKWPEGTVQWVDENGVELDVSTEVKANTAYKWVFTPKDTEHYDELTGSITLYSVSGSSGGGGGSDSNPVIKTETKNHTDGSTTKTETRKDGSVTQTTTGKDGSVSKTETKKDGSSVTENKAADGSTGTVKTDKNGQTTAEAKISDKAVSDAKNSGEAVKAPVEVEASRNSNTAPTVKVELPKDAGETEVEIPVSNAKPGTVAVIVHPDGTEEILKNSVPTEGGIRLTVDGSATVKIIDNSKDFVDIRNHWAEDEIDFVSARELVNGISATLYAPNASATRAQLWTILARQNDADLSGGANWYEKAQLWSKDKGISDGTNPNGTINRAQMVTMLWRTMGRPAAGGSASFADVPADSYYAQAVAWAVENGITTGVGGGRFDPNSTCTKAQIAVFLARSMK